MHGAALQAPLPPTTGNHTQPSAACATCSLSEHAYAAGALAGAPKAKEGLSGLLLHSPYNKVYLGPAKAKDRCGEGGGAVMP